MVKSDGFVRGTDDGLALWHMGVLWNFKVTTEESNDAFSIAEQVLPEGMAPPVHTHTREDEAWYVLDGHVRFTLGEREVEATNGDAVFGPRDVPHTFLIMSPTARMLTIIAPGNLEGFFHDTGEVATERILPVPSGPPDLDRLLAKMTEYGVDFVAPPPHH